MPRVKQVSQMMVPSTPKKRGRPPKNTAKADPFDKYTDSQLLEVTRERFDIMYKMAVGSTQGAIRAFIVTGAPGVGKTWTIEYVLEQTAQRDPSFRYHVIKGAITPVNLYKQLYKYRKEGEVIVLDDADSIFFNEDGINLLKTALDTGSKRKINWYSETYALKESGGAETPQEFEYNGTMIFVTNLDFQAYVDAKNKISPHMAALMSRSIYLDLKIHNRRQVALWVSNLIRRNKILIDYGISNHEQEEVIGYINANRDNFRALSIRTALQIAQFIKMDRSSWKRQADVILLKESW